MDTKENWERVQSLFLRAMEMSPADRVALLDSACAGQPELRCEVESLIAHDGGGVHDIDEVLVETAKSLFASEDVTGARLGAWRVLQEIGRGGMGTVYLASRDDDQFQKRAALKVVKRGMDTRELLNRFRRERQILAHLEHPYIARLIDAGNTPQGQPFLVMEYVQGKPIDVYCRELGIDIEGRCRIFLKVCEAVSYAHRNLVIHRDLKPGNILVTADGSPKLLDFGVAKLLDTEIDPAGSHTIMGGQLLTPEYASPEQVRGGFVGTATDIYALGTILYELLTGVRAQSVTSHSPSELDKVICQTEVQPPSECVRPASPGLRKRLSGDLDNIVLMAMRKEPERRYSSVDLFAEDIQRHLGARPVIARPTSFAYRFSKYARRNRLWLAAGSLVAVSLVGGVWVALVQAHHARIEQRRAEARLSQMVELANRALFDVHGSIERLPGATDARRQLVGTTLDFLEKLSKDAGSDERLAKALGAAYSRLGDLQGYPFTPNLGDTAGAMKSYRTGAALLDQLRHAHPDDAEALLLWFETQAHLATLLNQRGNSEGATKLLNNALPAATTLARLPSAGVDAERVRGDFYGLLAEITEKHNPTEALAYAGSYLEIYSRLAARYPDRADFINEQSSGYALVGHELHVSRGDSRAALENFLRCVALREGLVKTHPNDVVYKRSLMIGYGHVGDILGSPIAYNLGDSAGARGYYRKAVAIGREVYDADPRDSTAKYDLAASLERLGMVDVPASELAESLSELRQSRSMLEELATENPDNLPRKRMLALVDEYCGHRLRSLGRYDEAIQNYRRSVALSDSILTADPSDRPALSQAVAASRGMATAMAMAGNRSSALRQAHATIARAEAGVGVGTDPRMRQRYLNESIIELGSIYEILAKHEPVSQQRPDWEVARSALQRAISALDTMAAGGNLLSIDTADLKNAKNLLAEADKHLSAGESKGP